MPGLRHIVVLLCVLQVTLLSSSCNTTTVCLLLSVTEPPAMSGVKHLVPHGKRAHPHRRKSKAKAARSAQAAHGYRASSLRLLNTVCRCWPACNCEGCCVAHGRQAAGHMRCTFKPPARRASGLSAAASGWATTGPRRPARMPARRSKGAACDECAGHQVRAWGV